MNNSGIRGGPGRDGRIDRPMETEIVIANCVEMEKSAGFLKKTEWNLGGSAPTGRSAMHSRLTGGNPSRSGRSPVKGQRWALGGERDQVTHGHRALHTGTESSGKTVDPVGISGEMP